MEDKETMLESADRAQYSLDGGHGRDDDRGQYSLDGRHGRDDDGAQYSLNGRHGHDDDGDGAAAGRLSREEMEHLFRTNYMKMYRAAKCILYDDDDCRDVVSEVLEEVFRSTGLRLRPETTEAYLLRSVRNRCRNRITNLAMRQRVGRLYALELGMEESEAERDDERMDMVMNYLDTEAQPLTRRIFELRYREEMTYEEISQLTGVSRVTVYHHLAKTLSKLRSRLVNPKVNPKNTIR